MTSADLHSPIFVHKSPAVKSNNAQLALYHEQHNSGEPVLQQNKPFICDLNCGYDDYKNDFACVVSANNHANLQYYDSQMNTKALAHGSVTDHCNNDMYNKKQQQRQQDYYCSSNSRSSSSHFNTDLPSVATPMDQLNNSMDDMRVTGQKTNILRRNINKQLLDSPLMDKQSHKEHVYTSADLNNSTTTTLPSTTGDHTQHQFFCSTQGANYNSENINSKPKWSHVVADNGPNKNSANYNELTLFNSNKDAVHGYQNKKSVIGTSCPTSASITTSLVEHQPIMYKTVNKNNSDNDSNARPIRRHSSPYIKYNDNNNDSNSNGYNSNNNIYNNGIKRLSDSMAFQMGSVGNNELSLLKRLPVAKITNVSKHKFFLYLRSWEYRYYKSKSINLILHIFV